MVISTAKPVLVIPTHVINELFVEAFNSVMPFADCFKSVVVSINSKYGADCATAAKQSLFGGSEVIWETKSELSPIGHFVWYTRKLKHSYPHQQQIMFLCYDDLLNGKNVRELFSGKRDLGRASNTVHLGDYKLVGNEYALDNKYCVNGSASTFGRRYTKAAMTRRQWFCYLQAEGHAFTNLSGTIVPLHILIDVARFLHITAAQKGLRFEYMLASHRSVQRIVRNRYPIVTVRQHEHQEGRNVRKDDHLKDELRYCLWLVINARSWKELVFHLRGRNGMATTIYLVSQLPSVAGRFARSFHLLLRITHRLLPPYKSA